MAERDPIYPGIRFTAIPDWLRNHPAKLKPLDLNVWSDIRHDNEHPDHDQTFPALGTLAKRWNVSTDSVVRSVEKLEGLGFLKVQARFGATHIYVAVVPAGFVIETSPQNAVTQNAVTQNHPSATAKSESGVTQNAVAPTAKPVPMIGELSKEESSLREDGGEPSAPAAAPAGAMAGAKHGDERVVPPASGTTHTTGKDAEASQHRGSRKRDSEAEWAAKYLASEAAQRKAYLASEAARAKAADVGAYYFWMNRDMAADLRARHDAQGMSAIEAEWANDALLRAAVDEDVDEDVETAHNGQPTQHRDDDPTSA